MSVPTLAAAAAAVDDGIDHGTARGYRQHWYRQVPPCTPCREAYNADERARYHERRAPSVPKPPVLRPTGECHTPGCGADLGYHRQRPFGWLQIQAIGSADLPRLYCSGICATRGVALAELRALREPA